MFDEALYGVNNIECKTLYAAGSRAPVLFLHGYSFTGTTWVEAGIAGPIAEAGYRVAMPDMPYGRRTECTKHTRDTMINVKAARRIVERFLGGTPFIVGASLGGRIALYYAAIHGTRGLLLASPALKSEDPVWSLLGKINAPALIVRGSRDFIPVRVHRRLADRLGAELVVYEGAGHAMYLDMPGRFVADLRRFLEGRE